MPWEVEVIASLRIDAFQRFPGFDDVAGVGETLLRDLLWADEHQVNLALFPEGYLQGYSYDQPTIARRALSFEDIALQRVLAMLAPIRTTAIIGMMRRSENALYNSAIVVAAGKPVGAYDKAHPNEDGVSAGNDSPIFDLGEWRFGINICNDANFPEAAEMVAAQGARLLCYPLNNTLRSAKEEKWRHRSVGNLQARALQTGCWVMSADVTGVQTGLMSYGCTLIVRPDGKIVARAAELEEALSYPEPRQCPHFRIHRLCWKKRARKCSGNGGKTQAARVRPTLPQFNPSAKAYRRRD